MTTPTSRTASHIAAMDTTFKDDDLMWRAVTGEGLQDAAYVVIIVWETVDGDGVVRGGVRRGRR